MATKPTVTYTFRTFRLQPYEHLFSCDLCSAATDDPDGHAAWHENLKPPPKKPGERATVTVEKGPS